MSDPASRACAACGAELVDGARFCEACGAPVDGVAAPSELAQAIPADDGGGCGSCGGAVGSDGFCTSCGHRALEPVDVDDRGTLAAATHRGRRHHRNEDAVALAATAEGWQVVAVADGVSASPNPHLAARAAVDAATRALAGKPFGGMGDVHAAVAAAHEAASATAPDGDPSWPADGTHPACTIVVAVAAGAELLVANVGDARAYVVQPAGEGWVAGQLTTDDSVAARAVAEGIDPAVALALPGGHAIEAWLGADAPAVAPHERTTAVAPGQLLLVCSDGLWNDAPTDDAMGSLLTATLPAPGAPVDWAAACRDLVEWANGRGGADNITAALVPLASGTGSTP